MMLQNSTTAIQAFGLFNVDPESSTSRITIKFTLA